MGPDAPVNTGNIGIHVQALLISHFTTSFFGENTPAFANTSQHLSMIYVYPYEQLVSRWVCEISLNSYESPLFVFECIMFYAVFLTYDLCFQ